MVLVDGLFVEDFLEFIFRFVRFFGMSFVSDIFFIFLNIFFFLRCRFSLIVIFFFNSRFEFERDFFVFFFLGLGVF